MSKKKDDTTPTSPTSNTPKKPVSEKQLRANRLNARKSTGPTTAAGKRASSRNSLKFGITAKELLLPGESEAALDALREGVERSRKPADALQGAICAEVVGCLVAARRNRKAVTSLLTDAIAEEQKSRASIKVQRSLPNVHKNLMEQLRSKRVPVGDPEPTDPAAYAEAVASRSAADQLREGEATLLGRGYSRAIEMLERVENLNSRNMRKLSRLLDDLAAIKETTSVENDEESAAPDLEAELVEADGGEQSTEDDPDREDHDG